MFVAILGWNGAMPLKVPYPVWYQELVGSGRYSVYRTAMRMPLFLIVVHHVVSNGCWQRVPPEQLMVGWEQVVEFLSSAPSDTMNSTSCGVSPFTLVPPPGFGMSVLMALMALSKSVSVSSLQFDDVRQLLL